MAFNLSLSPPHAQILRGDFAAVQRKTERQRETEKETARDRDTKRDTKREKERETDCGIPSFSPSCRDAVMGTYQRSEKDRERDRDTKRDTNFFLPQPILCKS